MLLDYYQLREQPFGVTPDARFLYASATHREALASLLYAIEAGRGFAALIAQPGMGKTTLLKEALGRLGGRARTAFLFQTVASPAEFLAAVLADLDAETGAGASLAELQSKLNRVLEEQARLGRPVVLFIDEAQNLDNAVLEMVRMLSNFETSQQKLMQIVLSGQPQLAERLQSPDLVQLRQRISIVAKLEPFSADEAAEYVRHRLSTAGYKAEEPLFTREASFRIAEASGGIPRNINNLCFNALSLGCALKRKPIDEDVIREVVADLDLRALGPRTAPLGPAAAPFTPAARDARQPVAAPWRERFRRVFRPAWVGAAAAVLLAAILLAGMVLHSRRKIPEAAAVQASGSVSRQAALPAAPGEGAAAFESVVVAPGETLSGICRSRLGSDSLKTIARVRRLNPGLDDPDFVEAGKVLRIPLREDSGKALAAVQTAAVHVAGSGDAR